MVGFVALVPTVGVLVELDGLLDVLEVVDDEVLGVLDVLEVLLLVELEVVQSLCASWLTVPAPWPRFFTSVVVTDGGRLATALVNCAAALAASPHWCDPSAEEMECS